jgi:hypothetical protein
VTGPYAGPGSRRFDRTSDPQTDRHTPPDMSHIANRSTKMNLIHEDLARAQLSERLGEAHELRRGHQLARARRLSRRAERAAEQARLAAARSL